MNTQQIQQGNPQLNPDEAAASLAFATSLSQHLRGTHPHTNGSVEPQDAPEQEKASETANDESKEMESFKSEIDAKFKEMEKITSEMIKNEMSSFSEKIMSALNE